MSDRIDCYISNLPMIRDHGKLAKERDMLIQKNVILNIELVNLRFEFENFKKGAPKRAAEMLGHMLDERAKKEPHYTQEELAAGLPAKVDKIIKDAVDRNVMLDFTKEVKGAIHDYFPSIAQGIKKKSEVSRLPVKTIPNEQQDVGAEEDKE